MTKQEFEDGYISRSGMKAEEYHKYFVTISCACDYEGCRGWAAISNFPKCVETHLDLYAPRGKYD